MSKKTVWFEVAENETMDACLQRMNQDGYMAVGRKEEPLFEEVDGKPVPIRQIVKFKGTKME
ncbi:NETI motif-containing protein [Planococcus glaciei]|uniref:NETI motif-containing protein n=1 Tax=Planococcus glaciei TaxID=459472 RepID=UPI000883B11D|nr:NETI motif-containing protein [Planococcus glaciei]MBX0316752.1 NETI motif-containing protein [Planococcus glaciei]SDI58498.1 NETI protein [Planococcus glaciei]